MGSEIGAAGAVSGRLDDHWGQPCRTPVPPAGPIALKKAPVPLPTAHDSNVVDPSARIPAVAPSRVAAPHPDIASASAVEASKDTSGVSMATPYLNR